MADKKNMTLNVKIIRSRKLQRVICLECGKEFADLLLSLLVMPVGTILKHLGEGGLVKSDDNGLFNLYKSIEQMEASAFTVDRKTLVDPVIYGGYSSGFLRLTNTEKEKCLNSQCNNVTQSKEQMCDDCEAVSWKSCPTVRQPHRCSSSYVQECLIHFHNQAYGPANKCPYCGQGVSHYAVVLQRKGVQASSQQKTTRSRSGSGATRGPGFVEKNITFMVKEDLTIMNSSALSTLALIQSLKSELSDLDMKEVQVGQEEGLQLVRAAMVSKKPLTDVFHPFF